MSIWELWAEMRVPGGGVDRAPGVRRLKDDIMLVRRIALLDKLREIPGREMEVCQQKAEA